MPKYCFRYPLGQDALAPDSLPGVREVLQHQDGTHYACRWTVTDTTVQAAITADPLVEMISEAEFEAAQASGNYGAR
jgi:hypothetical protein